ncbi:hypothetical protein HJ088_05080 [Vibrio parahaemolyticus]|uniref:hypothetical protein n=1 Tax=Vibrio parahaemolyticus TaxID=670 RepID=UPI00111CB6D6|nr:hypothetical protein [Vibrio parahaemolyticus]MBE4197075.1 hypothetical protein [Vibrio parahaemolyticus]MBE5124499.1 hypothetical protein [Vibrio parahaemolyticus]HCG6896792.1 hypothetical protein [Vibrio parahaemolyticus]HCG6901310.1 hypothetical protein [Vibrio parahaemolyticus]HCM1304140.1 hypothetical protein [Vibrio parahaemolyticus]
MFFEKTEKCFWSVKHCHHINLGREERSKRIFGQNRVSGFTNLENYGLAFVWTNNAQNQGGQEGC